MGRYEIMLILKGNRYPPHYGPSAEKETTCWLKYKQHILPISLIDKDVLIGDLLSDLSVAPCTNNNENIYNKCVMSN